MTQLLQLLVSGLSLGAVYALLAIGFVVVYKASGVVNFAHPALLMVGAYVTARMSAADLPFLLALLAGIGGAAVVSLLVQVLLVSPVARRSVIAASILTIGVDVVIQTEINRRIGVDILPMGDPWQNDVVAVAGLTVPQTRIVALVRRLRSHRGLLRLVQVLVVGDRDARRRGGPGDRRADGSTATEGVGAGLGAGRRARGGRRPVHHRLPVARPRAGDRDDRAACVPGGDHRRPRLDRRRGGRRPGRRRRRGAHAGVRRDLSFLGLGFHTVMPYVVMVAVLLARPSGLFGTRELNRV